MKSRLHHSPKCDGRKCLRLKSGNIVRLSNEEAYATVLAGKGDYINKGLWKLAREKKAA